MKSVRLINMLNFVGKFSILLIVPTILYFIGDLIGGNNKIGDIGSVGRDVTINNGTTDLYAVHKNLSQALINEETEFVNLEKELTKYDKGLFKILNNMNTRLITLGDKTEEFERMYKLKVSETGKVVNWIGPCTKGYHRLDGTFIKSEHIRKTLGMKYYPSEVNATLNGCVFIGL